jgi:hypothetical protein
MDRPQKSTQFIVTTPHTLATHSPDDERVRNRSPVELAVTRLSFPSPDFHTTYSGQTD